MEAVGCRLNKMNVDGYLDKQYVTAHDLSLIQSIVTTYTCNTLLQSPVDTPFALTTHLSLHRAQILLSKCLLSLCQPPLCLPCPNPCPTNLHPEDSGDHTGILSTTTPVAEVPLSSDLPHATPLVLGASPHIEAVLDILATDNVLPNPKASHMPGYLKYDELEFQEALNSLIDPVGWEQNHNELTKQIVHNDVVFAL